MGLTQYSSSDVERMAAKLGLCVQRGNGDRRGCLYLFSNNKDRTIMRARGARTAMLVLDAYMEWQTAGMAYAVQNRSNGNGRG